MSLIKLNQVSKKYLLSPTKTQTSSSLKELLSNCFKNSCKKINPFSSKSNPTHAKVEEFWALKEINLTIEAGDRVAILGKNGAGKSTLLKLISRITEPTAGQITLNGKIVSLIEVGTGFHPDLTGRENILLNGAILGMSSEEIRRKFDEIVFFAEIEKFLETPVKHYSSGMHMRLGFSIAAHFQADVLIVDEILAVGDAHFQEKSLKKMHALASQGQSILFVSHNVENLSSICNQAILLHKGQVLSSGSLTQCSQEYEKLFALTPNCWEFKQPGILILIHQLTLRDNSPYFETTLKVDIIYEVVEANIDLFFTLTILNHHQQVLAQSELKKNHIAFDPFRLGKHHVCFSFDPHGFYPGKYFIQLAISSHQTKKQAYKSFFLDFFISDQKEFDESLFSVKNAIKLMGKWESQENNFYS